MYWDRVRDSGLGTLASEAAAVVAFPTSAAMVSDYRMLRIQYAFDYTGKTTAQGPLIFGLCVGASAAEVAEALLSTPADKGQLDEGNDANRAIWPLEYAPKFATEQIDPLYEFREFNPKWSTRGTGNQNGLQELKAFAFNADDAALSTGTQFGCNIKVAGVWVNDKT